MCGISMLFDPQGQLLINLREVRMLHRYGFEGIQSCSGFWCQLCHLSDTPHIGEGWSDPARHRPSVPRFRSVRGWRVFRLGPQSPREWTPLPDHAVAVEATLPRSEPLPEIQ